MKPAPFTYHRPVELDAALDLLGRLRDAGQHAKVLAGGQSLLPMLSMRLAEPAHVVDINALAGLDGVDVDAAGVRVGALVRHRGLERHAGAGAVLPLLRQALRQVAHPTIRNRGTSVGSLCHADPAAELPAVLALLGGAVVARSRRGERRIQAPDFFLGPLESALEPDELAVATQFHRPPPGTGTAFVEVARRHGDYAVCGVAAAVTVDEAGRVRAARAAYVSAGEGIGALDLGAAVAGAGVDVAAWADAGELARGLVATESDIHASAQYRSQLVAVLTARALQDAAAQAGLDSTSHASALDPAQGAR